MSACMQLADRFQMLMCMVLPARLINKTIISLRCKCCTSANDLTDSSFHCIIDAIKIARLSSLSLSGHIGFNAPCFGADILIKLDHYLVNDLWNVWRLPF